MVGCNQGDRPAIWLAVTKVTDLPNSNCCKLYIEVASITLGFFESHAVTVWLTLLEHLLSAMCSQI
jgi:hypothetical protein